MSTPDVQSARRVSAWNIANYLTMFRIALVPVFGWILLIDGGRSAPLRWWAFGCFALAMITDRIDGDVARSRGLVTDFGKVVDPIADKALVTMALVGLSVIAELPWWVTVVILVREWGVTAIRLWVIRHGVMAAGRGGKLKTFLQAMALGFFVMPRWTLPAPAFWDAVAWTALIAALIVTVVTGVDYVVQALRLRQTSPRAQRKREERARRRESRRSTP